MANYVGLLQEHGEDGIVALDKANADVGKNIFIKRKHLNGAPFGMKVVVEVLNLSEAINKVFYGKIIEVLGDPNRPDVAILGIIKNYGLPECFPEEVISEASHFPLELSEADITAEIAKGRRDLRKHATMTIDGEDAKDLDDAVDIQREEDGTFRLWVHIADVTHYLKLGTKMDEEAQKRGNSVYLVDRVLPMLPPKLSNGICSLNPDQDRLTLTAEMLIDQKGEVIFGEIYESVIRSKTRTSYLEVKETLETGAVKDDRRKDFYQKLKLMKVLADVLTAKRRRRGSLDFEIPETEVELDQEGNPLRIFAHPISFANKIIEEFMIAANEYVAEFAGKNKLPVIYRVHDLPDAEKLERVVLLAQQMGVNVRFKGDPSPKILADMLSKFEGKPFAKTLDQLLLRSLAKAEYSPQDDGHFGLASEHYCHFTSPIRRYPDTHTHRVLKAWLHRELKSKTMAALAAKISVHSSETERTAISAERDCISQKSAEYFSKRLGEEYEGIISGFSSASFFVQLENTIEGAVFYRSLKGFYTYHEEQMYASNERTGESLLVGDKVKVKVVAVDINRRFIDFELLNHERMSSIPLKKRRYPKAKGKGRGKSQGSPNRENKSSFNDLFGHKKQNKKGKMRRKRKR